MSLITLENVSFAYDGKPVAEGINFTVDEGDYISIVGENGSGKSTLIKGICGLKKPSGGRIIYSPSFSAKETGYLPQKNISDRSFPATVREVVLSGCANRLGLRPFYTSAMKKRASDFMELLSISELSGKSFSALSGGQQQRVLLARALCASDRLLLLDEPSAGLDPVITDMLYSLVKEQNRERGLTVIVVSHDLEAALRDSTRIVHLGGRQLFCGTPEEYKKTDCYRLLSGGRL